MFAGLETPKPRKPEAAQVFADDRKAPEPKKSERSEKSAAMEPAALSVTSRDTGVMEKGRVSLSSTTASMKHQEPLKWWHGVLILIAVGLPSFSMVGCFSPMGYGRNIYNTVSHPDYSMYGDGLLFFSAVSAAILVIIDWWYMPMLVQVFTGTLPFTIFIVGTVCKGRKYPWAILVVSMAAIPVLLGVIRYKFCRSCQIKQFYAAVCGATLICGVALSAIWGWYIFVDDHRWDSTTQYQLIDEFDKVYEYAYKERPLNYTLDCDPDLKNLTKYDKNVKADIEKACAQAGTVWFLSWMCPGMGIGCDLFMFIFCLVNGVIGKMDDFSAVQRHLTRFLLGCVFLVTGMYATATMSATSIRLGSTLLAFFMAALILLCIWVYSEIDHEALEYAATHSHLMAMLIKVWQSEWIKAMFVAVLAVPMFWALVLSRCTQAFRIVRGVASYPDDRFTPMGRFIIKHIQDFPWTRILVKICILAEAFFMLQVGVAKATYIFLSWLNTSLADTSFTVVLGLVFVIGCTMFLLPPVPGLPVYLFAGILIGEKGRQDPSIGFWVACGVATVLSLFTKLCACVGQYMIGYFLGKSVKVQQLIGVDKVPTRAIEMILKSRGLNPSKVSLLVGGPDWPTSVTCGIVRVNIPQMLLGTLPVVTLLAPCIMAGACMGRVSPGEDSVWTMAANASTICAAVVNMASMAYAMYAIGEVIEHHGEELAAPRPEHEAVAELTRQEQASVDAYNETIKWETLGTCWRLMLLMAAMIMFMANSAFVLLAEQCFRSFAVSSKIKDPYELDGLEGSARNIIISPVGDGALLAFFFGCSLHLVWSKIMSRKARALLKSKNV